ncbi:MAG: hypothetical protein HLUCCA12_08340 [Rhodobacteraceae bacterium HLUCCA12]|nr:MAG: hypothetical protein HLUCCA12_08340 [Rhodobacteraceae bacterium HLUCCA12]
MIAEGAMAAIGVRIPGVVIMAGPQTDCDYPTCFHIPEAAGLTAMGQNFLTI